MAATVTIAATAPVEMPWRAAPDDDDVKSRRAVVDDLADREYWRAAWRVEDANMVAMKGLGLDTDNSNE
jgi:hypothetical protein